MLHALVVEDEALTRRYLAEIVEKAGFTARTSETFKDARRLLDEAVPDVLLIDLHLPDGVGLDLIKDFESRCSMEAIVITANASMETVVEALHLGASDYLTKPIDRQRLSTILANIKRLRGLSEEVDHLRSRLRRLGHFGPLIGSSPAMQGIYDLVERVAPTEATVLISGESGSGKEVVARTVHEFGRRNAEPYLAINCGAISPTLIESELFGHEAGSFTGANNQHKGYFERASGGTLFLDEITEMPVELQTKLLRVLETGGFLRIGGDKHVESDVRVIAATNRPPEEAVKNGALREDLFYRLNVFSIALPPLHSRGEDIDLLAGHFLAELNKESGTSKRLTGETLQALRRYRWPGNVRELKNAIQRAFILADNEILPENLPRKVTGASEEERDADGAFRFSLGTPLAEIERRVILETLEHYDGNKKKTSETLGLNLRTLYNRLNSYKESAKPEAS